MGEIQSHGYPSKRQRAVSSNLKEYVVETTMGQQEEVIMRRSAKYCFSALWVLYWEKCQQDLTNKTANLLRPYVPCT
jgi:hypothetical protein